MSSVARTFPHPTVSCRFSSVVHRVVRGRNCTITSYAVRDYVPHTAFLSRVGPRQGQDSIVPMYMFGASRTQELLPGCESKLMRALADKVLAVDWSLPGITCRPSDMQGQVGVDPRR